jgi:membrane-associated phospholipid phosphatase
MSAASPARSSGPSSWARLVTTSAAFAVITTDVLLGGPLSRAEQQRFPSPPGFVGPWRAITKLGDRPALAALTTVATVVAVNRRHSPLRPAALSGLGVAARWLLMRGINRDRPPQRRWLADPDGASYPSRHATSATLGLLALKRELPASEAVTAATALFVAVECWSRLRLGVHWPTDVTAGVLLALMVDAALDFQCDHTARHVLNTNADRSSGASGTIDALLEPPIATLGRNHV